MVEIIDTSLLIEPDKKWFNHKLIAEPDKKLGSSEPQISQENLTALKDEAKKLLDQDIIQYNQWRERTKKSETNWMRTVLNKGTLGDKISVSSVLIQESAVHNLNSLQSLIGSVKLSKKRECILAMDALKGLFSNYLLPSDRPLATFQQHSFRYLNTIKEKRTRDKCLVLWYFEANLKEHYNSFIRALQGALQDNLAATKFKVCSVLFELIASNQFEQERYILEVAINKLGDPDHQVASRILFYIKNFLFKCPKMKMAVLNEVERLVTRPNINSKAQYYGFCCLNQFVLAKQDQLVANKLLVVYFAFFKKFVRNKEIDSRMLSALLTGVNRAYKFAKMDSNEIDENLNTIFKLVHITSFNVSLQALMLLNQVAASREDMQNRYFSALYRKMFDLESKSTAKETFFLNLLYNSLIKDEAITRVKAFVKRLFQICFSQNAPFVCGSFILISEFLKVKKNLFHLDYSVLNENGVQVQKRAAIEDDNEDEEEHFEDVKGDSDSEKEDESEKKDTKNGNKNIKKKDNRKAAGSSWQHQKNVIFKRHDRYDYHERNPLYAGADKTLTYELLPFTRHFHPTVVVFANRLLNNEPVDYTGDPMEDFTLIHFLDRFVYKNPKKVKEGENQPKKSVFEPVKSIHKSNTKNLPVNSKEYLNLDPNQIPEEEKFFYNYYKAQAEKKSKLDEEVDSEAESISDSEFDAYLNNTEVDGIDGKDNDLDLDFADAAKKDKKKKKKKDAESESDSDDDLLDLDDEFESDDEFEKAMNEEGGEEEEEEAEEEEEELPKKKSSKKSKEKDFSSLFAAADEFSELINESSKYDEMGVGGISNADNANPRQLRWEMDRDDDFARGGNKNRKRNKSKKPNPVKKRMGGNKVKVNKPKKLKKK